MRPILVMPMHDPAGVHFAHLLKIMPQLGHLFAQAYVGVTAVTAQAQPQWIDWLRGQAFFRILQHPAGLAVGHQFRELYTAAATTYAPERLLHLCFIDRVAFALEGEYARPFVGDIGAVQPEDTPLIFQRSARAWATHPGNYRALEGMITTVGELLFGRALDFAWCHFVVQAGQLREIMPQTDHRDLSLLAEMVVRAGNAVHTKDVDWLAWEDPFIEGRDADELRQERESSRQELRKRLAYVLPSLQLLRVIAEDGMSG